MIAMLSCISCGHLGSAPEHWEAGPMTGPAGLLAKRAALERRALRMLAPKA